MDNYFQLGGDSITAIQVVSLARSKNVKINVQDLLRYPTIASLSSVCSALSSSENKSSVWEAGSSVPFTPIQAAYFKKKDWKNMNHFNQSFLYQPPVLDPQVLQSALQLWSQRHDALSLRFRRVNDTWEQFYQPHSCLLEVVSIGSPAEIRDVAQRAQESLDIELGPLLRVVLLSLPDGSQRLLITIHHLIVDGVSWRILLPSLRSLYNALAAGATIPTTPSSATYQSWAQHLLTLREELNPQWPYWQSVTSAGSLWAVPTSPSSRQSLEFEVDADTTQALLGPAHLAYNTRTDDLLLAGLALALRRWKNRPEFLIYLEGHGRREDISRDLYIGETVGWFTSIYPIKLSAPSDEPARVVKATKEYLRGIPMHGVGYGILKYLGQELPSESELPQISFNYLGAFGSSSFLGDWKLAVEDKGHESVDRLLSEVCLDINGWLQDGKLHFDFTFRSDIGDLFQFQDLFTSSLKHVAEHCMSLRTRPRLTPSDFPNCSIREDQLDRLYSMFPNLERIYGLTPLQEGLLYQALQSPGNESYCVQHSFDLDLTTDLDAWNRAWTDTVDYFPILRTSFVWDLEEPVQVVSRRVLPPIFENTSLSYAEFLSVDRQRGFEFAVPSGCLRFTLIPADTKLHFVFTSHHLLLDGWSTSLVFSFLLDRFAAYVRQAAVIPLAPSPPFEEFVSYLRKKDKGPSTSFWSDQLASVDFQTELSLPRGTEGDNSLLKVSASLAVEQTTRLSSFAAQHSVTLSTVVQAALSLLLSAYTRRSDVIFGVTVSGRSVELGGVEGIVGLLINTLPIRFSLNQDVSVGVELQRMQDHLSSASDHADLSLAEIQKLSQLGPGTSLFEVLLVIENYKTTRPAELPFAVVHQTYERTHYGLTLDCSFSSSLEIVASFSASSFREEHVSAFVGSLVAILGNLPTAERFSDVVLIPTDEILRVARWNNTTQPFQDTETIGSLFEAQVERTPSLTAICFEGNSLTYKALNSKANGIAHMLGQMNSGPLVCVCVDRSLEMMSVLLGIVKSGRAFVPIDSSFPSARVLYILEDTACTVAFAHAQFHHLFEDFTGTLLDPAKATAEVDSNLGLSLSSTSLAYVIYTSGTTGNPKGVLTEHRAIVNRLEWMSKTFNLGPQSVMFQKSPLVFDDSVTEVFGGLLAGARLVIAKPNGHKDPQYTLQTLHDEKVTLALFVPSMLDMFLQFLANDPLPVCLRDVIASGEALTYSLAKRFYELLPNVKLWNLYGPAEAAVDVTSCVVDVSVVRAHMPIGLPMQNVLLHVVTPDLREAPLGAPGELLIGGTALARGYLNKPDLTTKAFIANPFLSEISVSPRLYRTGDLVRRESSGSVEFVGRIDHQVKLRGYRIELGEIQAIIASHPDVETCVAHVREINGDKRLVAYFVGDAKVADLRELIAQRLPSYMVPSHFLGLESIPTTVNGKVDLRALSAIPLETSSLNLETAPVGELEELVLSVVGNLLNQPSVSLSDDFFALGGHSLLVMRLVSRLNALLGIRLPIQNVFADGKISTLVKLARAANTDSRPPLAAKTTVSELAPASFGQQRMWFLSEVTAQKSLYNICVGIHLDESIPAERLVAALSMLVARQQSLRCSFVQSSSGEILQHTLPLLEQLPLRVVSGSLEDAPGLLKEEQGFCFDLTRAPLWNLLAISSASGVHSLVLPSLITHSDGWSNGLFWLELRQFFEGKTLAPLPVAYSDYAAWQKSWMTGDYRASELKFWKENLANVPPVLRMPTDRERPAELSYHGATDSILWSPHRVEEFTRFSRQNTATLYMTLMTTLTLLLYSESGQEDFVIGGLIANRDHENVTNLIGFFVNTLALRFSVKPDDTFLDVLRRTVAGTLAAHEHQHTPFEEVVEALDVPRLVNVPALFQVLAIHQVSSGQGGWPGSRTVSSQSIHVQYDMVWEFVERPEGLEIVLSYMTQLYQPSSARRLLQTFDRIADHMLAHSSQLVALLDPYPPTPTIPAFDRPPIPVQFLARARASPQQIALSWGENLMTYGELADLVAHIAALISSLVSSGQRVVVSLDRTPNLVAALLAVSCIGATYVPVDPKNPSDRLAYIVQNSRAVLVLADQELPVDVGAPVLALASRNFAGPPPALEPTISPSSLAYILYTSGSTGRPKGVELLHSALSNVIAHFQEHIGSFLRCPFVTSISFDISGVELWATLTLGGCLYLVPAPAARDGFELSRILSEFQPTIIQATPSTFRLLKEAGWQDKNVTAVCGGEHMASELAEWLIASTGKAMNCYGPTETTIWSFGKVLSPGLRVTIGHPVAGTTFKVCDPETLRPCKRGVQGELLLGGVGLAVGYVDLPEQTQAKFVSVGGERFYRTGDSVRHLPTGEVEFVGRADFQLKVQGFRIEPGEIEAVATRLDLVRAAVVILHRDALACVIEAPESAVSAVFGLFHRFLPAYMIPRNVFAVDALPVNTARKVDRGAVAQMLLGIAPAGAGEAVTTTSILESTLLSLWESVLGHAVSPLDDFFAAGGTSLAAMRLVQLVNSTLDLQRDVAIRPVLPLTSAPEGGPATFLFPPAAGTAFVYLGLRNRFPFPMFALTNPDFGQKWRYKDYNELAAAYAAFITSTSPPPYALTGYSVGGHLALLTAAQLVAQGFEVTRVVLLDSMILSLEDSRAIEAARDQAGLLAQDNIEAGSPLAEAVEMELAQMSDFEVFLQPPTYPPPFAGRIILLKCEEVSMTGLDQSVHPLVQKLHDRPSCGFSYPQLEVYPLACAHGDIFRNDKLEGTISALVRALGN